MLPIRLDDLTVEGIDRFVADGLSEGRRLDFKSEIVGSRDEDKREFLCDVSSFAHTIGGDLIFGLIESEGVATQAVGLDVSDADAVLQRLDSLIRMSIEPRLPRYDLRWIVSGARRILVCRIPQSFVAPHRVTARGHDKFYARNNSGKYAMDVSELRTAMISSEGLPRAIRAFRKERVEMIDANEAVMPMGSGSLAVLHIVPLLSFTTKIDVQIGEYDAGLAPPTSSSGWSSRYTLDGHVSYVRQSGETDKASSYATLFRGGVIEAAFCIGATSRENGTPYVPASAV